MAWWRRSWNRRPERELLTCLISALHFSFSHCRADEIGPKEDTHNEQNAHSVWLLFLFPIRKMMSFGQATSSCPTGISSMICTDAQWSMFPVVRLSTFMTKVHPHLRSLRDGCRSEQWLMKSIAFCPDQKANSARRTAALALVEL